MLQQEDRIVIEHVVRTVDEAKVQREELKKARVQASVEKEKIEAERIKSITPAIMLMMLVLMLVLLSIAKTPPVVMLIVVLVGGLVAYKSVKQNSSHDKHDDNRNE